MFSLFGRNRVSIDSLVVPDIDWKQEENRKQVKKWINPESTLALSLNYFSSAPDVPTVKNLEVIRTFYRELVAQSNGGLIEVDFMDLKGVAVIRTIFKFPMQDKGVIYLGSITIPFKEFSFVLKIEAPELGVTGMRDSFILNKLLSKGRVTEEQGKLIGWSEDPYDKSYTEGTLMNQSELAEHDKPFPKHPLSQLRSLLSRLESEIDFKEEVFSSKPFEK